MGRRAEGKGENPKQNLFWAGSLRQGSFSPSWDQDPSSDQESDARLTTALRPSWWRKPPKGILTPVLQKIIWVPQRNIKKMAIAFYNRCHWCLLSTLFMTILLDHKNPGWEDYFQHMLKDDFILHCLSQQKGGVQGKRARMRSERLCLNQGSATD